MKRIFTADIHLSIYQNSKLKNGLAIQLYDIFSALKQMVVYAKNNSIDIIEIGGDLFNDKNLTYTKPLSMFTDFLEDNKDIMFRIINGNHDMDTTSKDQISLVKTLKGHSNVEAIIDVKNIGNTLYVPFTNHIVDDILKSEPYDILISHFGLNEAQLSTGISLIADIGMSKLSKFKLVLLGHYHKGQELKNANTHLFYVGTPFQKDWNEKHQDKRFLVYDTETLEVESIPISGYTKYVELILENRDQADELILQSEALKKDGHNVRIRNKTDVELDGDVQVIVEKEIDITNRGLNLSMTTEEQLKKYIEIKEISKKDLKKYLEIGKELCEVI